MPKKLYGAAAAAHAKKHGRKGKAKKHAKKGAKKRAKPVALRAGTFAQGLAAGLSDVRHGRPLRKTGARKDDYSHGYRNGVAQGRREKKRKHH